MDIQRFEAGPVRLSFVVVTGAQRAWFWNVGNRRSYCQIPWVINKIVDGVVDYG